VYVIRLLQSQIIVLFSNWIGYDCVYLIGRQRRLILCRYQSFYNV